METKIRTVENWGWGGEEGWGVMFNEDRASVSQDEKVPEVDSGDGYTTMWMPENLEMVKMVILCYVCFTSKEKNMWN